MKSSYDLLKSSLKTREIMLALASNALKRQVYAELQCFDEFRGFYLVSEFGAYDLEIDYDELFGESWDHLWLADIPGKPS